MTEQQGTIVLAGFSIGSGGNIIDLSNLLAPCKQDKCVLFETPEAAQEVAYMLRAEWDGCTGVKILDFDLEPFRVATALGKGEWYEFGYSEPIPRVEPLIDRTQEVLTELNRLRTMIPVSRAEVYWAISDWKGSQSAESVSQGLGFSKSTVQSHLSALEKAGAIRGEGRPKQYTIAEDCPQEYLSELQSLAGIARTTRCYWRSGHAIAQ